MHELPICGHIVDAGCGAGAILARVAKIARLSTVLTGIEIQEHLAIAAKETLDAHRVEVPECDTAIVVADFLTWTPNRPIDLIIGNPPFSRGEEFARRARELTRPHGGTVSLLLRLDWLGSQERRAILEADPPDALILERRPQFRQGIDGKRGTDSCEYAWMVWGPGRGGRWKRIRCAPPEKRLRKIATKSLVGRTMSDQTATPVTNLPSANCGI